MPTSDPQQIQPHHDEARILREERRCEQAVDGQLGRAAHERRQQDGHFPVPLAGQGAGGHHRRDGAAKADEHGHDAAARQADAPQQLVHHEGHAGHVAAVLHQGQEEEQRHDDGQKAQHAAHAGEDAADDQTVDGGVHVQPRQSAVRQSGQWSMPVSSRDWSHAPMTLNVR